MEKLDIVKLKIKNPNGVGLLAVFIISIIGIIGAILGSIYIANVSYSLPYMLVNFNALLTYILVILYGAFGYRIRKVCLLRYIMIAYAFLLATPSIILLSTKGIGVLSIASLTITVFACLGACHIAARLQHFKEACVGQTIVMLLLLAAFIINIIDISGYKITSPYQLLVYIIVVVNPILMYSVICGSYLTTHYLTPSVLLDK